MNLAVLPPLTDRESQYFDDEIWIYCVKSQEFTKSSIKCPYPARFDAFSIKDNDDLLVSGYVRYQWQLSKMNVLLFPPQYLIKLMEQFYPNEFIHLFDLGDGGHWKIKGFDLIPF